MKVLFVALASAEASSNASTNPLNLPIQPSLNRIEYSQLCKTYRIHNLKKRYKYDKLIP